METSRRLLLDYFRLLRLRGLTNAILRIPPDFAEQFEANLQQVLASEGEMTEGTTPLSSMNPLQGVLEIVRDQVENGLVAAGLSVTTPRLVVLFPTGSFNAEVHPVPGGVLVLIHTAALTLLTEMLRVNVWSAKVDGHPPRLNHQETVARVARLLHSYLRDEHVRPTNLPPTEVITDITSAFMGAENPIDRWHAYLDPMVRSCLCFMVAHEYGHLAAGHHQSTKTVDKNTPVGQLALVDKTLEQEFEADILGANILLACTPQPVQATAHLFPAAKQVSPLFYFTVHGAIDRVKMALGAKALTITSDHPPSAERWHRLHHFFLNEFARIGLPSKALDLPEAFEMWFTSIEEEVIAEIQRLPSP
jgi:hypothetical protein